MTETMNLTLTGLLCPSCENPMGYTELTHSYRCLVCNPIPMDVPTCATQKCLRPLTRLGEPWNCWICLHCNTHPSKVSPRQTKEADRPLLDVQMTEEKVREIAGEGMTADDIREIVRDTMAEFSAKEEPDPDYPPTQAEIRTMTAPGVLDLESTKNVSAKPMAEAVGTGDPESNVRIDIKIPKPETWMQKAKRLGIQTHIPDGRGMRKKVDIMADVETKENETVPKELRPEEQTGSGGG